MTTSTDNQAYTPTDKLQKQNTITTISNFIKDTLVIERLGWSWNEILVPCIEDSAFDRIHRSGKVSLSILLRSDEFHFVRARRKISDDAIFLVNEHGRLFHSYRNMVSSNDRPAIAFVSRQDITADVAGMADFDDNLQLLAKVAALSGGWIITGDEITVGQWLCFHGLQVPDNEQDTRGLLDLLNFSTLPEQPKYANCWEVLDAPDDSPFKLDDNARSIIRDVTRRYTWEDDILVHIHGSHLMLASTSADGISNSDDFRLQRLIDGAVINSGQAKEYLDALGWVAGKAEKPASPELVEQLLIAVLLLDLDPNLDAANTHFAGFDLYSKSFFRRHPDDVRAQLEKHLIDSLELDSLFAPLVAHMVLAGMAPEYLFTDWPQSMRMGTPTWVVATQAVHLVEVLVPGASRKMNYQHLMGFTQSVKAMGSLAALHAVGSVDPVVTWAWMNGYVTRDADGSLSPDDVIRAAREYERYIDTMIEAAARFSTPLPDRKQLALDELKSEAADCNPHELLVKHRGTGGGAGRKVSVLDLYMGDELHTEDWDRIKGGSIYKSFPGLSELFPVAELYATATASHLTTIVGGLAGNIQIAISQLNAEDAAFLQHGAIGVYCVQNVNVRRRTSSGRTGINNPVYSLGETGRYGVILCAQYVDGIRCFELFPLRMECRRNLELEGFFKQLVFGDYLYMNTHFVDQKQLPEVPIDLKAYLQNGAPAPHFKRRIHVRKIGTFAAIAAEAYDSAPLFRSARTQALAELISQKNPYITESEIHQLGLQQTEREKAIEKSDAIFNMILNLIIPFKSCVEGLASGDPKKHGGAIFDCIVDAAVLALTFVAAPVAIAAAATKAATIAGKLLAASRILASTAISLFNPISGLPQLLKGAGKLLGRGAVKLSGQALELANQARQQLRFLSGANGYDLLKAIDHTGSAAQARMSLDTVAHGRALLKSDAIETAQQIVTHLSEKNFKLPKGVTETELGHLANNAVKETAYQSKQAGELQSLIGRQALEELTEAFVKGHPVQLNDARSTAQSYTETLTVLYELESKKARYMKGYQKDVLKLDLGRPPYNDVMPDSLFNPMGYTDHSERAAAWMLNGSTSNGNNFDNVVNVLREYTANKASLTDPAVIRDIHRHLVPQAVGRVRDAGAPTKYGSSPTGFALLEEHLQALNASHEHFDKHVLAAVVGFQGFGDGNGRTASALYAISQLRRDQFKAMPPHVFRELNGIF
ncbi:hypothetical protein ACOI9X_06315 [Pseudomonas sp. P2757]|uniref:hypothetical protein n=1 Tax=unclassified Pseudomonas TaxID=196821 RepID=UPI003B5CDF09